MALPSRRRFLNHSIGGFAAVMAANAALAADEKSADAKPKQSEGPSAAPVEEKKPKAQKNSLDGANERINVAVIGCGGRGQSHIGDLLGLADYANLVAICDPDEKHLGKSAEHIEEESGVAPKTYSDIRKLLEDKEIDAVSIATPNHWHTLAAIMAIQAGKDVYVEKPLSHNISEGRRLVEFARKHNKVVLHGTQARSSAGMRQAMRFLHEGGIGKVFLARGLCYKSRPSIGHVSGAQPTPEGLDYDIWCGPAPMVPLQRKNLHYDWHWIWDTGNGDLGNQGVHQMDICAWGLNKQTLPTRVQCIGGRLGYIDDGQTFNSQVAVFGFDDDDAQVIFEVRGLKSKSIPGAKDGVCDIFYGTEGTMVVSSSYGKVGVYAPDGSPIEMPVYDTGPAGNHFTSYIKAIKSRKLAFHEGESEAGHVASGMCHMANISNRLGGKAKFEKGSKTFGDNIAAEATVSRLKKHLEDNNLKLEETEYLLGPELKFDTKTERFVDNELANGMLSREYRAPFTVPDHVA